MLTTGYASRAARPTVSARRASVGFAQRRAVTTRVANVTQDSFEAEVLKSDTPVLVDFWANWCGPCKLVAPLMEWVEKDYKGAVKVVKVEHDANPDLIEKYKVYGLPALIVVKDGELVPGSKHEGAISKALLGQYLAKHGVVAP